MPSAFDTEFETFANSDLFSEFGETVTRIASDGTRDDFTGIVHLDEPIRDDSGMSPTLYTGTISISESIRDKFVPDVTKVDFGNKEWHVVDVTTPRHGMCEVGIRFEIPEHSNAIDLQGNQHAYG